MPTPAEAAIRDRIAREGPITFRDFMEMALYSAPGSYYGKGTGQIGPRGDYLTSPEIHPAFGALLCRQVEQVWVALNRPQSFTVVEMGAGSGALARDVLAYAARWSPDFFRAMSYLIVEPNPAFRVRQRQALSQAPSGKVAWDDWEHLVSSPPVRGCFLTNELLDAFPVHRVVVAGGAIREVFVGLDGDRFVEVLAAPSTRRLPEYFELLGFLPPEGAKAEVNLAAAGWIRAVPPLLGTGSVITLDYGYPAEELYSARHLDGSLLCFYRHTVNSDPYARVGLQDMTTHVDFTTLAREGELGGLDPLTLTDQRSFVLSLGMGQWLGEIESLPIPSGERDANWVALRELVAKDGLGQVKVLIQSKGLAGFEPAGLRPTGLLPDDLGRDVASEPVPLLTPAHMRLTAGATGQWADTRSLWEEMLADNDE